MTRSKLFHSVKFLIVPPARYASRFHANGSISKTVEPNTEGNISQLHSEAGGRGTIHIIPLLLVLWSFISVFWAKNETIALFRSIKLLEFYLLYVYVVLRLSPMFHVEQTSINQVRATSSNVIPKEYSLQPSIVPPARYASQFHANSNVGKITKSGAEGTAFQLHSEAGGRGTIKTLSAFNVFIVLILFLGLFQSFIAIWQFIAQHSVGLFWLKESFISPEISGVAKVIFDVHKIIRAYGLFPHPNILGGFLLFSIILTLLYKNCSTLACSLRLSEASQRGKWNNQNNTSIVPRGTIDLEQYISKTAHFLIEKLSFNKIWLIQASLFIQIIALFLTFSKSAIIGIIIALVYINVPRGTFNVKHSSWISKKNFLNKLIVGLESIRKHFSQFLNISSFRKMFHVEQWHVFSLGSRKVSDTNKANKNSRNGNFLVPRGTMGNKPLKAQSHSLFGRKVILILGILISSLYLTRPDLRTLFIKSLDERLFYLNVSRGTISDHPIIGVGAGQFVLNIPQYTNQAVEQWQFQPVHNIFLLIWSELGLIGLGLFILFLWTVLTPFCLTKRRNGGEIKSEQDTNSILNNESDYSSSNLILRYFKAILLGFLFIMLFDHYLWDIQQGSFSLWIILGLIAGFKEKC